MRRDSAGVIAGEERDLELEERTTRLPDADDALEDPAWDDENELTEAWDWGSLAPWHAPEAEQAPDWALELTTAYDKPATQEAELAWDGEAALTRRFDVEPAAPNAPLHRPLAARATPRPAEREAFAAESGAYPTSGGKRRVGAETLRARGREPDARAKSGQVRSSAARWPLAAAWTDAASDDDAPRLLQAVPPRARAAAREALHAPVQPQFETQWPSPPRGARRSVSPQAATSTSHRSSAYSSREASAPATTSRRAPAAATASRRPALQSSVHSAVAPAGMTSRRPALRSASYAPPSAAEPSSWLEAGSSEPIPSSARTTSRRPALRGAVATPRMYESLAPVERVRLPAVRRVPASLLWAAGGFAFVAVCVAIRVLVGTSPDLAPEPTVTTVVAPVPHAEETGFTLLSRPAGAQVFVDGRSTGLITPARVRPLSPGLHAVELKLAGYYDTGLPAVLESGMTVALGDVELRPLPPPIAAGVAPAPRSTQHGASSSRRAPRRSRTASSLSSDDLAAVKSAPAPVQAAPLAAQSGGTGLLQINSRPWARILIDGEFVGNTPQLRVALAAGTHSVRLVNESLRMSKTFSVVIRSGETVTRIETLSEEPAQSGVLTHGRNLVAKLGR